MLSNPFHVDIMFFQRVFGKKNPDNGIYVHAFTGIKISLSALVQTKSSEDLKIMKKKLSVLSWRALRWECCSESFVVDCRCSCALRFAMKMSALWLKMANVFVSLY